MYEKIDKLNEYRLYDDYMLINIVFRRPLSLSKSPVLYIKIVELFFFLLQSFPNWKQFCRDTPQVRRSFIVLKN